MPIPIEILVVLLIVVPLMLFFSWGSLRARMWARKNGYRFVKGLLGQFVLDATIHREEHAHYQFVVENDKGRWRTAVTNGVSVWWADEPRGVTTIGLSERGWREPEK